MPSIRTAAGLGAVHLLCVGIDMGRERSWGLALPVVADPGGRAAVDHLRRCPRCRRRRSGDLGRALRVDLLPRLEHVLVFDTEAPTGHVRRRNLAQQRTRCEFASVTPCRTAPVHRVPRPSRPCQAIATFVPSPRAIFSPCDLQAHRRPSPPPPARPTPPRSRRDPRLRQPRVRRAPGVTRKVRAGDTLALDDLDIRYSSFDRRLEALVALTGDEEVRLVMISPILPRPLSSFPMSAEPHRCRSCQRTQL